jgi:hypothetical protein
VPLPPEWLQINGQTLINSGVTNADGSVWGLTVVSAPSGATVDVTPTVTHALTNNDYTFTVQVDGLKIFASTNGTAIDLSTNTPEFCVGQKVTFSAVWDFDPGAVSTNYSWAFSSKFVNHSSQASSYASTNWDIDSGIFTTNEPYAYWVSGGNKNVYLHETLHFSNGQSATFSASGQFSVYKPSAVIVDPHYHGTPTVIWERPWWSYPSGAIQLGVQGGTNNMSYLCRVISSDFGGMAKITQICNIDATGLGGNCSGCLDGSDPYNGLGIDGQECSTKIFQNPNPTGNDGILNLDDAPDANDLEVLRTISMNDAFVDYVMFNPDPSGSGIYVTLAKITWDVSASVTYANTNITQNADKGPHEPTESDEFPIWTTTR